MNRNHTASITTLLAVAIIGVMTINAIADGKSSDNRVLNALSPKIAGELKPTVDRTEVRSEQSAGATASAATSPHCPGEWTTPFNDPGLEGETIYALAVYDGKLIAGGTFTTVGGATVNHVAQWDGESWSALGDGVNRTVRTMIAHDGSLYVGGQFSAAGGNAASYIARWDGEQWHALNSGFNNAVMSVTVHQGNLIAGGLFTHAGDTEVNRVARWDTATDAWQPLGTGLNRSVLALKSMEMGLVAGGQFNSPDGDDPGRVALWDGQEWATIGNGFAGSIRALGSLDGMLVAGGSVQEQGLVGVAINDYTVFWDGSEWNKFLPGMSQNHMVHALLTYGTDLSIAGRFTLVVPAHFPPIEMADQIARWDGDGWQSVGEGLGGMYNASAEAMVTYNGKLIVAGYFAKAGGEPATSIAAWDAPPFTGPADLNCDGVVNTLDLLILLENWGKCDDPDDCPPDLNSDGVVNVLDLLILLENWS